MLWPEASRGAVTHLHFPRSKIQCLQWLHCREVRIDSKDISPPSLFFFWAAPSLSCGTRDLVFAACRVLSWGMGNPLPWWGIEARSFAFGAQSLSHREVPKHFSYSEGHIVRLLYNLELEKIYFWDRFKEIWSWWK